MIVLILLCVVAIVVGGLALWGYIEWSKGVEERLYQIDLQKMNELSRQCVVPEKGKSRCQCRCAK